MNDFFQYIKELFEELFANIGRFFQNVFANPWAPVPEEFEEYGNIFNLHVNGFGAGGWILFVLFWLLFAAFFGLLLFILFLGIKKYIHFTKKEIEKEKLQAEIEQLNYELYKSVQDKDKILNLKAESLGVRKEDLTGEEKKPQEVSLEGRFAKLTLVDEKYQDYNPEIVMAEQDKIPLNEIVERFRKFAASQLHLYYEIKSMRAFFAGLGTSKLLILEGISGTGKTSLPYALGKFFQNNAKICSVQPSWRDRSELLGYYNEFTKKFNETEFLRAVYEATYREDLNIVILDEMNLARIEYYFAEFLSIMEMPNVSEWNIELITNADENSDPKHLHDGKLLIPQNIWFIGTANNDDSTFTITDKVYDRAISLFFNNKGIPFDCEFTEPMIISYDYLTKLYQDAQKNYPVSPKLLEKFDKLDSFVISKFKLAFGNRILKQLTTFIPNYVACGGTELEGLDFIFATKILKKFEALNLSFLKEELKQLESEIDHLFGRGTFVESKRTIEDMIKSH